MPLKLSRLFKRKSTSPKKTREQELQEDRLERQQLQKRERQMVSHLSPDHKIQDPLEDPLSDPIFTVSTRARRSARVDPKTQSKSKPKTDIRSKNRFEPLPPQPKLNSSLWESKVHEDTELPELPPEVLEEEPLDYASNPGLTDRDRKMGVRYQDWSFLPLFGDDGPSATDVVQAPKTATCWVLGPLASIASQNPGAIRDMIREDSTGKYQVRFFPLGSQYLDDVGPIWVPVDATLPTKPDQSLAHAGSLDRMVLWPAIVEKAFAKFNKGGYENVSYGHKREGSASLTGNATRIYNIDETAKDRFLDFLAIKAAYDSGKSVVCSGGGHLVAVLKVTGTSPVDAMFSVYDQQDQSQAAKTYSYLQLAAKYPQISVSSITVKNGHDDTEDLIGGMISPR